MGATFKFQIFNQFVDRADFECCNSLVDHTVNLQHRQYNKHTETYNLLI